MTKGSKRRPGKGYDVNYDKVFKKEKPNAGKPLTDRDRFYDGLPPVKIKDNTNQ